MFFNVFIIDTYKNTLYHADIGIQTWLEDRRKGGLTRR